MSVLNAVLTGLCMGVVFGFALEKSRVFEPGMIVGQMRMQNFTMLKIFLAAVVTGLVIITLLYSTGLTKLHPKALIMGTDVLGGLILGAGIAITGACPGTIFTQIGAGYKDAWLTLIGGLLGALCFTYFEPELRPLLKAGDQGKITLDTTLGLPFSITAIAFALILVLAIIWLERFRAWQDDLGLEHDGQTA